MKPEDSKEYLAGFLPGGRYFVLTIDLISHLSFHSYPDDFGNANLTSHWEDRAPCNIESSELLNVWLKVDFETKSLLRLAGGWQAVLVCVLVRSFWEESPGTNLMGSSRT